MASSQSSASSSAVEDVAVDMTLEATYVDPHELSSGLRDYALDLGQCRAVMAELAPDLKARIRSMSNTLQDDMNTVVAAASGPYRSALRIAIHDFIRQRSGLWYLLRDPPSAPTPPSAHVPTPLTSPSVPCPRAASRESSDVLAPSPQGASDHHRWVPVRQRRNGDYDWPSNTFVAGQDALGHRIFVTRTYVDGELLVGSICSSCATCYVCLDDRSFCEVSSFEVLVCEEGLLEWVHYDHHGCNLVAKHWKLVVTGTRPQVPIKVELHEYLEPISYIYNMNGRYAKGDEAAICIDNIDNTWGFGREVRSSTDFQVLAYRRSQPIEDSWS